MDANQRNVPRGTFPTCNAVRTGIGIWWEDEPASQPLTVGCALQPSLRGPAEDCPKMGPSGQTHRSCHSFFLGGKCQSTKIVSGMVRVFGLVQYGENESPSGSAQGLEKDCSISGTAIVHSSAMGKGRHAGRALRALSAGVSGETQPLARTRDSRAGSDRDRNA